MSVLDELKILEQQVTKRLRELEPLVDEYEQLQQVASRLGLDGPDTSGVVKPRRRGSGQGRSRRAAAGGRRADIQRLVAATPGMTVSQIGKELSVDPTSLYRPVRQLVEDGVLAKRGAALHPTEARASSRGVGM